MSNAAYNNSFLQENYTLNGQKEYYLVIDCKNCPDQKNEFFKNEKCLHCVLLSIYNAKKKKFKEVLINSRNLNITEDQLKLLFEYFKKLKILRKYYKKIQYLKDGKCIYKEFDCKRFQGLKKLSEIYYLDPLYFFNIIYKTFKSLKKKRVNDSNCINCVRIVKHSLDSVLKRLYEFEIIRIYLRLKGDDQQEKNFGYYYEKLLFKKGIIEDYTFNLQDKNDFVNEKLIKTYNLGTPPLYQVSIFDKHDEYEKRYAMTFFFNSKSEQNFFRGIIQDITRKLDSIKFDKIVTFSELINIYRESSKKYLDIKYNRLLDEEKERIAYLATLKKVNLEKLFPFLIDDHIEEIFLDSPDDTIYLNHQEFGRCITLIKLNMMEIERIKTFLRIYSGQRLDYSNPSLKFVMKNALFHCRFAIDVGPLQNDNFGLDIRKLNKNILSIQDLLKNGTFSSEIAAFLYFCIIKRINITVAGQTDTGKTTLINALDLLTPKDFRKIYVENIVESLNQRGFEKHQLKYIVDSTENEQDPNIYSKSNQIKTLLHRSPDLIYLGEILTKEEAQATFHCLASGLKGFQTIHSNSIESLLNRFIYFFNIEPSCLNDLGLIIFMKKIYYRRILISVSEIIDDPQNINKKFHDIFHYIPESKSWILLESLYNTRILENIKCFENISENLFKEYLAIYNHIFDWLYKSPKLENEQIISFFHKISYHSINSLESLNDFWINWRDTHTFS